MRENGPFLKETKPTIAQALDQRCWGVSPRLVCELFYEAGIRVVNVSQNGPNGAAVFTRNQVKAGVFRAGCVSYRRRT